MFAKQAANEPMTRFRSRTSRPFDDLAPGCVGPHIRRELDAVERDRPRPPLLMSVFARRGRRTAGNPAARNAMRLSRIHAAGRRSPGQLTLEPRCGLRHPLERRRLRRFDARPCGSDRARGQCTTPYSGFGPGSGIDLAHPTFALVRVRPRIRKSRVHTLLDHPASRIVYSSPAGSAAL